MRKTRPRISIAEGQRLRVMAIATNARADEMIDALIYWAYQPDHNPPRDKWREMIQTYRRSQRNV